MNTQKEVESKKRIAFSDCDPFRHLNNARYIDYFLDAREQHVDQAYGISLVDWAANGRGWVVRQNQLAYLRPANYGEEVSILSRLIKFSATELKVEMLMTDSGKSQVKAFYWSSFTHISLRDGKKLEHPEDFMLLLNNIVYQEEDLETVIFEQRLQQILGSLQVKGA